jgi:hypothetical protein
MITFNLSDPNSASQVLCWLKEQPRDCDECLHPATHPHPHPVKVAPAVFLMYVLCQSCKEHFQEHGAVYSKDDSARGIVRTYVMPRIAADSQRIADRMMVAL